MSETKFDGLTPDELCANLTAVVERVQYLENEMDSGRLVGRPEAILLLAAKVAYAVVFAYGKSIGDDVISWDDLSGYRKSLYLSEVRIISENPSITTEVNHVLWCSMMKKDGWKYGEKEDETIKTHPYIVPYSEMSINLQIEETLFLSAVRAVLGIRND